MLLILYNAINPVQRPTQEAPEQIRIHSMVSLLWVTACLSCTAWLIN